MVRRGEKPGVVEAGGYPGTVGSGASATLNACAGVTFRG